MTLSLPLRPEIEDWLRHEAARAGSTPEQVAVHALETQWATSRIVPFTQAATDEDALLAQINDGFSHEFWARLSALRERLQTETITDGERQEFIRLYAQVEAKNAERISYLLSLAQKRGVSLPDMMQSLGIGPLQVPPLQAG